MVMDRLKRTPIRLQDPIERRGNFDEVCLGYSREEAILEASRCLKCKKPLCVEHCPVKIDIPGFIEKIEEGKFKESLEIISKYTSLPGVCGRVCPQEDQCEMVCVLGKRGDPIAIGKLERFIGDFAIENNIKNFKVKKYNGHKVAVVGSGPAGITCAGELAKLGYKVKIFEALHEPGGVLVYGIPEFRLPKDRVVKREIDNLIHMGVEIETNVVVGRTLTIDEIFQEGYEAIFIGSGAGLPVFMNIKGLNSNGVFSANEFLTRSNLMKAYKRESDTPIKSGKKVAIIGGGNVAMDAARTAKRLGSEVTVIYRRTKEELPARIEEVENAIEEGIEFQFLTNPIEIINDENNWVTGLKCIRMQLGEEDDRGRRRPYELLNSDFILDFDTVIMALGTNPNPLIPETTEKLDCDSKNRIIAALNGRTSRVGVFAGGDNVTGSATVILAMGAGRESALEIDKYIRDKKKEDRP